MLRIPEAEIRALLEQLLAGLDFLPEDAGLCARLFAEASRDGVPSHGLNRFPRFARMVREGHIRPRERPAPVSGTPPLERWDGGCGPGNLNAHRCMARAITLARVHGVGCVALANTNHWMRGGTYGWQAADAGLLAICWTNTMPNLPPWGATESRIGNNPLVMAVPRSDGHVVLDMAVSQFSIGALESHRRDHRKLPVVGGFDVDGNLSDDPAAILDSDRSLPIGYWKGSGLSLLLDMFATLLSGGLATHEILPDPERETRLSQVFIAIDPSHVGAVSWADRVASEIVDAFRGEQSAGAVRYPGERVLQARAESQALGIPVDPATWDAIVSLRGS